MPRTLSHIAALVALVLIAQPIAAAECEFRCLPPAHHAAAPATVRSHDMTSHVAKSCHGPEQEQTNAESDTPNGGLLTPTAALCVHGPLESLALSSVVEKIGRVDVGVDLATASIIAETVVDPLTPSLNRLDRQGPAPPSGNPQLSSLLRI